MIHIKLHDANIIYNGQYGVVDDMCEVSMDKVNAGRT